ncbi:MAG: ferrochelatase [Proteobacteria bacterium]|uniref:Ferrochelatase n=1 Tax=Candidatus Avisuccinivibrio stercorigallinarum TaxID=2840704 RepID=A0A9D9DAG0_9GAMM|nr:ferrochelatase [Candidatus Avisuccinivibrio stercorigallinarum]
MPKALLLINTGSPLQADTWYIKSFLANFFADPHVFRSSALLRLLLKKVVLPKRAPRLQPKYQAIFQNGKAPQDLYSRQLCTQLSTAGLYCTYAFLYAPPLVLGALDKCRRLNIDELYVLPLYPQSSITTTHSALDQVNEALEKLSWHPDVHVMPGYAEHPAYISALAGSIKDGLEDLSPGREKVIYCSYHSLPMSYLKDAADAAYIEQCHETTALLSRALGGLDCRCAFQSAFGPAAWQGPFLQDLLLSHDYNRSAAVVICPGFAMDCLETLHEVEIKIRQELRHKNPAADFKYIPCLNASRAQAALIAALLKDTQAELKGRIRRPEQVS